MGYVEWRGFYGTIRSGRLKNLATPADLHLNLDGIAIRLRSANQGAVSSAGSSACLTRRMSGVRIPHRPFPCKAGT